LPLTVVPALLLLPVAQDLLLVQAVQEPQPLLLWGLGLT
jgi:hypothetical protein